jgi:ABC-2 type transport system permease protein
MSAVYLLTLRQLSGRWRLGIMTVLAALPVLFTFLVVRDDMSPFVVEFENIVLSAMLAGSIGPLIVVAIASAAFSNEVEDRTLANLTLAPLPRWRIVLPKFAAAVTVAGPFIVASAFVTGWLAFNHDVLATVSVTLGSLFGVFMYAAAFVWLGLVTRQAIGVGLAYIVLWEGFFSGFVSGVRFLSIRFYSVALMHGMDARRFVDDPHVGAVASAVTAAVLCAGFLYLSTRRLRQMDVP